MDKKISAVVVTFNRKELLKECIEAMLAQSVKLNSIHVVDNCSTDGTYDLLKNTGLLNSIKYRKLKNNLGASGGFYYGIEEALKEKPDWIWVMDDDAILKEDALDKLISNKYFSDAKTGALVSSARNLDLSIQHGVHESLVSNAMAFKDRLIEYEDFDNDFLEISSFSLLGVLVRAEVVKKVGNVDKRFFIECDDLDFSLRIADKYKMFLVKNSILIHKIKPDMFGEFKIFNRTRKIINVNQLWKEYYSMRNFLFILKKRRRLTIKKIIPLVKKLIIILGFLDYKILRTRIFFMALKDGITGKLGKRFDYNSFKRDYLKQE
jgi:rhamnopyranosyl-N-acetylglucosaminyl-diphospho-decaprenol beta-1,3/1,4-galactofuranosyltransferase